MSTPVTTAHADYLLGLADDALISAQRLGWWISRAPQIEEDLAMANIGLDQLGQARSLLSHAGSVAGAGEERSEDDLAYFRDEREFHNVCLVERKQTDFAVAMARLLVFATWQHALYAALAVSTDPTLAAISGKAVKETAYHLDHARTWVLRLGDGTEESHERMQEALNQEWPWREELYDSSTIAPEVIESGVAVDPATLRKSVEEQVNQILIEATCTIPDAPPAISRGRSGLHTEAMGYLLAEMQHLARSHRGASW